MSSGILAYLDIVIDFESFAEPTFFDQFRKIIRLWIRRADVGMVGLKFRIVTPKMARGDF